MPKGSMKLTLTSKSPTVGSDASEEQLEQFGAASELQSTP